MATKPQIAYGLDNPLQNVFPKPIEARRAPKTSDHFQVGQVWVDVTTNTAYMLTSIAANLSQWTNLVGGGTGIFNAVEATLGNITADVGDIEALLGNIIIDTGTLQIRALSNCMLLANGVGNIITAGAATNGQILIGSTGAIPVLGTITAGAGITVTNGAGTITIAAPGVSVFWQVVVANQPIVADNGYICNSAGTVILTLPAVAAVGDTFEVMGKNAAVGWRIAQNAGQTIHTGSASSTTGLAGYAEATSVYDWAEVTCITANTDWALTPKMGSITIA